MIKNILKTLTGVGVMAALVGILYAGLAMPETLIWYLMGGFVVGIALIFCYILGEIVWEFVNELRMRRREGHWV